MQRNKFSAGAKIPDPCTTGKRYTVLITSFDAGSSSVGRAGTFKVTNVDDLKTTIRRNKLLGMWAAEKLELVGQDAEAYANALAVGSLDPERSDVFSKIRKDFDAAGVVQSDEQILRVMNELTLQAASQTPAKQGGGPDAAALMLARNLTSR